MIYVTSGIFQYIVIHGVDVLGLWLVSYDLIILAIEGLALITHPAFKFG